MSPSDKALVVLSGAIKTPPLSSSARVEAGHLLRQLQKGETLSMPHSRPMSVIGPRCHELRIPDPETDTTGRIMYRIDPDEIVITEVFAKKSQATPRRVIDQCKRRLKAWDSNA